MPDGDILILVAEAVHLAQQLVGTRDFIGYTMSGILMGQVSVTPDDEKKAIFSPFGLSVNAIAKEIRDRSNVQKRGTIIPSFLLQSGLQKSRVNYAGEV